MSEPVRGQGAQARSASDMVTSSNGSRPRTSPPGAAADGTIGRVNDLTPRETTPLEVGHERFTCLWPGCDWFIDWDPGAWMDEHTDTTPVPPEVVARHGGGHLGIISAVCEAVVTAYAVAVEESLHTHMDLEHDGWTLEELQHHAAAYDIGALMGHG